MAIRDKTSLKILFFADTHLGFDLPLHPRVERRRRGPDFFANYHHILNITRAEQVDLLIHGGDLFFRSKVPAWIVDKTFEPLVEVANTGIPIYLVPGNHERSKFPGHLWLAHENIHVFDRPKTYTLKVRDVTISLSGFPFARHVKHSFQALLQQTDYREHKADLRLLCLHQTFEGAKVGPSDFTFRVGPDNLPGSEIPGDFAAVLSGHIHRAQQLTRGLDRQPLPAPVIYPGSIERTSFAERFEEKYYVLLKLAPTSQKPRLEAEFSPLPTRPMIKLEIPTDGSHPEAIKKHLRQTISTLDPDSIVRIQFIGPEAEAIQGCLSASDLRAMAPATMNVSLPIHPSR